MKHDFLGKNILVITAHPDDESYAAAGTIYKNHAQGGRTTLICASLGERGVSHIKTPMGALKMKTLRKQELRNACRVLSIRRTFLLNLPDGKIATRHRAAYAQALRYAQRIHPEVILSYGPDGISGHRDHVAIGKVARRIAKRLRIPFYAFTLPPSIANKALRYLKTRRSAGHYVRTIRYAQPTHVIAINPALKKRALRCHRSQMDGTNAFTGFPAFAVESLLRKEYFVRM